MYSRINQETPTDQLDAPDATTVDPARELSAAEKANSKMSTVAAPIQTVASALSGTDNPIALVDWISSLLKSLKKFHATVDQIATVSITLWTASPSPVLIRCLDSSLRACSVDYLVSYFQGLAVALRWSPNLVYRSQAIIDQANRDNSIRALLLKMDEVYTFLTTAELEAITSMKAIVERITLQTVQCSYFIQAYCRNQKFRKLT